MAYRSISPSVIRRLPRYYRFLEDLKVSGITRISSSELSKKLQTKVMVKYGKKCGKIEIEYYSAEELENILKKIK